MRRAISIASTLAALFVARAASADTCQRPTDPGGVNGYEYGADTAESFDGKDVRIWFTRTGPHAVNTASTRSDGVPDDVVTAATVADSALDGYASMGFSAPISDGGSGTSCGGTPALDIYLMHFTGADGDTATETCTTSGKAERCTSFGLVEAKLASIYGTFELGAHVVIAHELFHSVQDAYDAKLDRFWAEGTAQWAAKSQDPAEKDLESFLPSFFKDAGRSIDVSPGGVVADYLYGAAIWPVFLTEAVSKGAVRGAFEQEGTLGAPSMAAIDVALQPLGSSVADAYPKFAAWNAATGKRAGTGGYANAATYPELALQPLDATGASAIILGFSGYFYSFDFGASSMTLSVTADETRVGARTFPLVAGKAQLDRLATLPATVSGQGVVVVVGISSKKNDAPFTLSVTAPSAEPVDDAGVDASSDAPPTNDGSGGGGGGGCDIGGSSAPSARTFALALACAATMRRRRT